MKLVWSAAAIGDLVEAREYVAADNPAAAAELGRRTSDGADRLERHPTLGRPGRVAGTRELVIAGTQYLVVYRIRARRIEVMRVWHARRRYPPGDESGGGLTPR